MERDEPAWETLDPSDWDAMRELAHRMVDDMIDYHRGLGSRPAWQPLPAEAKRAFAEPFPSAGRGDDVAYEQFSELIRPYSFGNAHPRGWGWVNGTGSPMMALAEMWASSMNPNVWGGEHAAPYVEAQVIEWAKQLVGMPQDATGLLVTGGSVANLVGLTAAREGASPGVSTRGMVEDAKRFVIYASAQAHNSIDKAAGLLGIGWNALRHVPVDADYRMDVGALEQQIADDRAAGFTPMAIVATAATVNTGAIDDIDAIADVCARERIWLHVDGAFGALLALSPSLKPLLKGMERADSIAFDLHKWLYVPIEAGCVLVRHPDHHRAPFSPPAAYLASFSRGVSTGAHFYGGLGPQLTRSFRALKVWLALQSNGTAKFGRLIDQNVRQAALLADLVNHDDRLELVAPAPLNIVCFRYTARAIDDAGLNEINREILLRLQESGLAIPSSTELNGVFALRVALTNHRTADDDLRNLAAAVTSLGDAVTAG
ncbi:MAG TPA: pyridoxal-dependent decarboxylase [Longimicrobiales bacterium]